MKTVSRVLLILMVAVCIFSIMPQNISMGANEREADSHGATTDSRIGGASSAQAALAGLESKTSNADVNTEGMQKIIANLLKFLQIASGLVAVLMIAIVGFNYIIGTPDVKNEMKTKMLPIIIGLILVFGAASIGRFILGAVGA